MAKYKQKFRNEWKTNDLFKNWISEDSTDKNKAFCKYCKCSISAKNVHLRSHAMTKRPKTTVGFQGISKIPFKSVSIKTQEQEAALALFPKQQQQAKHFIDDLQSDIGVQKFSLLLDEATDIGITKLLRVVIIYFSEAHHKVISTLLSMAELASGNADGIVDCHKTYPLYHSVAPVWNYTYEDLLLLLKMWNASRFCVSSLRRGHANLLCIVPVLLYVLPKQERLQKSVFTELKKEVPNLILIRCVCHSIQLAINFACKQCLPNSLEYLVNETYNWLSKSYSRHEAYKKLYGAINNGLDPFKITRVCDTRWLSIEMAISRVLEQWLELKTLFSMAKTTEKCFMAASLHKLYNDEINYGYLLFLKPILLDLQVLNKSFQN